MKVKLYLSRGVCGEIIAAAWSKLACAELAIANGHHEPEIKTRMVGSSKELAVALLQLGTSKNCIDAAWRMAVKQGAVEPSRPFREGDDMDFQTIEYAKQETEQIDYYIGIMVNDPNSKFYLHG